MAEQNAGREKQNRDGLVEKTGNRWALVLSGGDGTRLRGFVRTCFGMDRPKQYCVFRGKRSLLCHTVDRIASILPPGRIVTVVGNGHRDYLQGEIPGKVIEQPCDRGSATSLYVGLAYIRDRDPDAIVFVLPAAQFIHPEERFLRYLMHAGWVAERYEDRAIALGADLEGPGGEFGWIEPVSPENGERLEGVPMEVAKIHTEGNHPGELFHPATGRLWNTMMVVARLRVLMMMGLKTFPEMMLSFEALGPVFRAVRHGYVPEKAEKMALSDLYSGLGNADFLRDVQKPMPRSFLALPMPRVFWSAAGTPEQVRETLHGLHKRMASNGWGHDVADPYTGGLCETLIQEPSFTVRVIGGREERESGLSAG